MIQMVLVIEKKDFINVQQKIIMQSFFDDVFLLKKLNWL